MREERVDGISAHIESRRGGGATALTQTHKRGVVAIEIIDHHVHKHFLVQFVKLAIVDARIAQLGMLLD